ncbi:hypothetical protein LTS18_012872, partial [Coniosporium uncinatum]
KRFAAVFVTALLVFLFLYNKPEGIGEGPRIRRPFPSKDGGVSIPGWGGQSPPGEKQPSGAPPQDHDEEAPPGSRRVDGSDYYYNGFIKFYKLASTMHSISRTMGYRRENRNVLFAVSSLKSASNLIPLACEMGKADRNYVHLAFLGRDDLPVDDILGLNGVDKQTCNVFWHDGRPDYSRFSTEGRAEASVSAALGHIEGFMHPQVIIMDDSAQEDAFFTRGLRSKAEQLDHPVLEVPQGQADNFAWLTRLDSGSLNSWHKAQVDILIHAQPGSSGSLIRLLKSLESADYSGLSPPRLTIELPANIEPSTRDYLREIVWPPKRYRSPAQPNQLTLRHRISTRRITAEEASVRFLESFYPPSSENSHVLLLSPQAELSPLYFHYLKYVLLEYKYSSFGARSAGKLAGVSLELPANLLNGTGPFPKPTLAHMNTDQYATQPS